MYKLHPQDQSLNNLVLCLNQLFSPSGKPLFPGKFQHEQLLLIAEGVCTSNSVFSHERVMVELTRDPSYTEKPVHPLSDRLPGKQYQSALNLLEKMIKFNPRERVTSEQALADPYFDVYSYPEVGILLILYITNIYDCTIVIHTIGRLMGYQQYDRYIIDIGYVMQQKR